MTVFIIEGAILVFRIVIGRPVQRWRARRLATRRRVTCVLRRDKGSAALSVPQLGGAARLSYRRIRLIGEDLTVVDVELPGTRVPAGLQDPGYLWFSPHTRVVKLHTPRGTCTWAVLEWQADWALEQIGFGPSLARPTTMSPT